MCLNTLGLHGLKLHQGKCKLSQSKVEYLGHMIYLTSLRVQKVKVDVISKVSKQINISWLRPFLWLANHYWQFVKRFSQITKPLTQLTVNQG